MFVVWCGLFLIGYTHTRHMGLPVRTADQARDGARGVNVDIYGIHGASGLYDETRPGSTGRWSTLEYMERPAAGSSMAHSTVNAPNHGYSHVCTLQVSIQSVDRKEKTPAP